MARLAAWWIFCASATLVPPNFCTISPITPSRAPRRRATRQGGGDYRWPRICINARRGSPVPIIGPPCASDFQIVEVEPHEAALADLGGVRPVGLALSRAQDQRDALPLAIRFHRDQLLL